MATKDADVSLLQYLDISQITCLNEQQNHDFKSIISSKNINPPGSPLYLESDVDAQLLLTITFHQAVRIRHLMIRCSESDKGPKVLKLQVNKSAISFSDVEGVPDSNFDQIIQPSRADISEGKRIALRFVRFQSINSLHIFVESNQNDEDCTRIDAFDVFGVPVEATKNLVGLRQEED